MYHIQTILPDQPSINKPLHLEMHLHFRNMARKAQQLNSVQPQQAWKLDSDFVITMLNCNLAKSQRKTEQTDTHYGASAHDC